MFCSFTEYFEGSNLTWVTMIERLRKFKIIIFEPIGEEVSYPKPIFYKGASACIIAFDKGDNTTFKRVKDWYNQIKENVPGSLVPITMIGLVTDFEIISKGDGLKLARELGVSYYETTPTDLKAIYQIFHNLVNEALKGGFEIKGRSLN